MTTKTALSDEEMAQRGAHPWLPQGPTGQCAFDAPSIQGKSNTFQWLDAEFLIANPELEFELNHRKQSLLKISNRKYSRVLRAPWRIAIFSLYPPFSSASSVAQPTISRKNIQIIRISANSRTITTYAFSNWNKFHLFAICLPPRFSPRKGTSRDMIPALTLLQ
jgi:hypothetical protein